jgi:medium-chain acyl-[acyl-carrier-protein] hydrolase
MISVNGASQAGLPVWLTRARRQDPRCWLLCFPHAGAGAAAYSSWARIFPPDIGLRAVQPPGREARLHEPPIRDARSFARALLPSVAALADRPVLLFGHSVGAVTAFELAREMRREGLPAPAGLLVSGRQAPHFAPRDNQIWALSPEDLLDVVRDLGGTPSAVLDDPDLVAMLLPALQADLEMNECYQYADGDRLDTPITAFAADRDERASPAEVAEWSRHTDRAFTLVPVVGGHFAITTLPGLVLEHVAHCCTEAR